MAWTRIAGFRHSVACLLVLCTIGAALEVFVADVCDGDASAAEQIALANDGDAHAALGSSGSSPDQEPAGEGHALHACHCLHAHGGVAADLVALAFVDPHARRTPPALVLMPPPVTLDPAVPPPLS
jgi:hypothetical protein